MNAFIIFDVSSDLAAVKAQMRLLGYYSTWATSNTAFNLPENSMWKPNTELSQARTDLTTAIAQLNIARPTPISVLRCIVLNTIPWDGIQGVPIP